MALSKDEYNKVKAVFDKEGIPVYIWEPIMNQEGGGNKNAHALTQKEDSRGLFQINVKANPQYAKLNLYDPVVNAQVAAKDFIKPAYQKAVSSGVTNPGDAAAYVWKNGIKPNWASVQSRGADVKLKNNAITLAGGQVTDSHSGSGGSIDAPSTSTNITGIPSFQNILWSVVGVILIIGGIFIAFNPAMSALNSVSKVTNAVGRSASNQIGKAVKRTVKRKGSNDKSK